jgi:transcriptional regulator with XRE-family HTH domain
MGFKENLKAELRYSGILVKELAAKSGIGKRTIDNYLSGQNSLPLADAAVAIARSLDVTVEYLVTGEENKQGTAFSHLRHDERTLLHIYRDLGAEDQEKLLAIAKVFKAPPIGVPPPRPF